MPRLQLMRVHVRPRYKLSYTVTLGHFLLAPSWPSSPWCWHVFSTHRKKKKRSYVGSTVRRLIRLIQLHQLLVIAALSNRRSRSEEHTSELQSRFDLVCRLLLEKKNGSRSSAWCQCKRRRAVEACCA